MHNLPWEKTKNNQFSNNRMVFQKRPSGGSVETPGAAAEWKGVDAMATFDSKSQKETIKSLAYNANTDDPLSYATRIRASLNRYMDKGNSLDDLWKYLKQQNCKYLVIAKGLLNFYNGNKKKINIEDFFTLFYPTESYKQGEAKEEKDDGRKDVWKDTKSQLMALKEEIEASQGKQA